MIRQFNLPTSLELVEINLIQFNSQKDVVELQTLDDFLYCRRTNKFFKYESILYDLTEDSNIIFCVKDIFINEQGELVQDASLKNK